MKLSMCKPGDTVRIRSLSPYIVNYWRLTDMGVLPGCRVMVLHRAPLGDPMTIRIRDYFLSLRREDTDGIEVE